MPTTTIRITHSKAAAMLGAVNKFLNMPADKAREAAMSLANLFERIASGGEPCTFEVQAGGTTAVRSSGTLTLGAVSGSVGGTIDGTAVTVTASGGAAGTIGPLVAAINANATVNKKVYAVATSGTVITLYAMSPGVNGNKLTLAASGTGMTTSGAFAGGAGDDVIPVSYTRS